MKTHCVQPPGPQRSLQGTRLAPELALQVDWWLEWWGTDSQNTLGRMVLQTLHISTPHFLAWLPSGTQPKA